MKHILTLLLILGLLPAAYTQVTYLHGGNGSITVRTSGTGKNETDASAQAARAAFYMLLYRGIPGSDAPTALIDLPEQEAQRKHTAYLERLMDNYYQTFITNAAPVGDVVKGKRHTRSVCMDMTINLQALRKDLEDNKVIRKFGF